MSYEEIMELTDKRNMNWVVPSLTEEEARQYYGDGCCDLIEMIYKFCREADYIIYQHTTNCESADNIMNRGFVGPELFLEKLPIDITNKNPDSIEISEDGVKTFLYNGGQCQRFMPGIRDELSDTQHFFENVSCHLDYGSLTNPHVNRKASGATVLFIVPKSIISSREYKQYGVVEAHTDDFYDREVPESYFERDVVPRQFCIGYLDVKNKKFVANPNFQFNYGVTGEIALGSITLTGRDLSVELKNNIRRNR